MYRCTRCRRGRGWEGEAAEEEEAGEAEAQAPASQKVLRNTERNGQTSPGESANECGGPTTPSNTSYELSLCSSPVLHSSQVPSVVRCQNLRIFLYLCLDCRFFLRTWWAQASGAGKGLIIIARKIDVPFSTKLFRCTVAKRRERILFFGYRVLTAKTDRSWRQEFTTITETSRILRGIY